MSEPGRRLPHPLRHRGEHRARPARGARHRASPRRPTCRTRCFRSRSTAWARCASPCAREEADEATRAHPGLPGRATRPGPLARIRDEFEALEEAARLPLPRSRPARARADAPVARERGRHRRRDRQRVARVPRRRGARVRHRGHALPRLPGPRRGAEVEDEGRARVDARRWRGWRAGWASASTCCSGAARRRPAAGGSTRCSPTATRRSSPPSTSTAASTSPARSSCASSSRSSAMSPAAVTIGDDHKSALQETAAGPRRSAAGVRRHGRGRPGAPAALPVEVARARGGAGRGRGPHEEGSRTGAARLALETAAGA